MVRPVISDSKLELIGAALFLSIALFLGVFVGLGLSRQAQTAWDVHDIHETNELIFIALPGLLLVIVIGVATAWFDGFAVLSWALVGGCIAIIVGLQDDQRNLPESPANVTITAYVAQKDAAAWAAADSGLPPTVTVMADGSLRLKAVGPGAIEWSVIGVRPSSVPPLCVSVQADLVTFVTHLTCPAQGEEVLVPAALNFFRTGAYDTAYGVTVSDGGPAGPDLSYFDDVAHAASGVMRRGVTVEFPTFQLGELGFGNATPVRGVGVNRGDRISFAASDQTFQAWDAAISVTHLDAQRRAGYLRDFSLIVLGGAVSLHFLPRRRRPRRS